MAKFPSDQCLASLWEPSPLTCNQLTRTDRIKGLALGQPDHDYRAFCTYMYVCHWYFEFDSVF